MLLIRNKSEVIDRDPDPFSHSCGPSGSSDASSVDGQFGHHKAFAHFSISSYIYNPVSDESTLINKTHHTD